MLAFQHRATMPPTLRMRPARGTGSTTQRVLRDSENIVTPSKPITLCKMLLQCTEGQCILVSRSTWSNIEKYLSSLWVISTLRNGSLKLQRREQGTEKRGGGLQKKITLLVPLCLQCQSVAVSPSIRNQKWFLRAPLSAVLLQLCCCSDIIALKLSKG